MRVSGERDNMTFSMIRFSEEIISVTIKLMEVKPGLKTTQPSSFCAVAGFYLSLIQYECG